MFCDLIKRGVNALNYEMTSWMANDFKENLFFLISGANLGLEV